MRDSIVRFAWCLFRTTLFVGFLTGAVSVKPELVPLRNIPMPAPENRFPVTHDPGDIDNAYAHPQKIEGENVALEGVVVEIREFNERLPFIKLRLREDPALFIWVLHSTPLDGNGFLYEGGRLRFFGYIRYTRDLVRSLGGQLDNENPLILQTICTVGPSTLDGVFDGTYRELCEAWQKGFRVGPLAD